MSASNRLASYKVSDLHRGDVYRSSEFDLRIPGVSFVRPCGAHVVTDTEHMILAVIPAPGDVAEFRVERPFCERHPGLAGMCVGLVVFIFLYLMRWIFT